MMSAQRRSATRGLHVLAMWSLAVAQPLYDLMAQHPTFLTAHVLGSTQILLLCLALSVAVPGVLALVIVGTGFASRALQRALVLACIWVLGGAVLLPWVGSWPGVPGAAALAIVALATSAGTWLYSRREGVREFFTVLSLAVLIFPIVFVMTPPVQGLVFPGSIELGSSRAGEGRPPVVMLVFDELPVTALVDEDGQIEASRVPNFARLARDGFWFRNASSVHSRTDIAIPALLTGNMPDLSGRVPKPPVVQVYPRNLFVLLSGMYSIFSYESVTGLCPKAACHDLHTEEQRRGLDRELLSDLVVVYLHRLLPAGFHTRLPSLEHTWAGFSMETTAIERLSTREQFVEENKRGRELAFDSLIEAIEPRSIPTFYFVHSMLPHASYDFLPSGRRYYRYMVEKKVKTVHPVSGKPTRGAETWLQDPVRAAVTYERFLAQVGFVDTLVGRVLDRLDAQGLYDEALIVVTADHGVTLRPGEMRRELTPTNYKDILGVPLFIKLPRQRKGAVDERNVELIDVVPTLLDALGVEPPKEGFDGISLLDASAVPRPSKRAYMGGELHEFPANLRTYEDYPGVPASVRRPWRASVVPQHLKEALIGQAPGAFAMGMENPRELLAMIRNPERYRNVSPGTYLPAQVVGHVRRRGGPPAGSKLGQLLLAFGLNGKIVALTQTFEEDDIPRFFSAMLPEEAFVDGENDLKVFLVNDSGRGPQLVGLRQAR